MVRKWVYGPHVGGRVIPLGVRQRTARRIRAYPDAQYASAFQRLDIRFRGALCYIDAWIDHGATAPLRLCRLRYFGNEDAWSMAFYTYSHERYEPLAGTAATASDTALGDWYVNRIVVDRQPLMLLVSSTSLLSVLAPARNVRVLPRLLTGLVDARLRRCGIAQATLDAERRAMSTVVIAATVDRSVLGIVVDFARAVPYYLAPGQWDFGEFAYRAKSWTEESRVVIKAEHSALGPNIRFVVTNLTTLTQRVVYEKLYCERGTMELLIKDLRTHLRSDRTSCHRFEANQFRLFLHSMAYILKHALRRHHLCNTPWSRAQFETIRLEVLKIGARVRQLRTRVRIHLPTSSPWQAEWRTVFRTCRASP